MNNEVLTIVAHTRANRGLEEFLMAEQKKLVTATRRAPGCLRYELNISTTDSGAASFVEQWASAALWEQHMASHHMDVFRATAGHAIAHFELHQLHQVA